MLHVTKYGNDLNNLFMTINEFLTLISQIDLPDVGTNIYLHSNMFPLQNICKPEGI